MSNFGETTTADEVMSGIDLTGKTIVVTGASSGLGVEASRVFAKAGATVVMAVRDVQKADGVVASIQNELPGAELALTALDLADLRSVRSCAEEILARFPVIDVLVNNAGIMAVPQGYTAQGCELQFGTNHIGHFLFTCLLVPALRRAKAARVVVLTSYAHRYGDVEFNDINYRSRPYDKWQAYGQSKTANALFAVALGRRLQKYGITANAVHPGAVKTDLSRAMNAEELDTRITNNTRVHWKTIAQGAATEVWAAVSPDLAGISGKYLEDCHIASMAKDAGQPGYLAYVLDETAAEKLWDISEKIVGQRFAL
jgi:NAD(P)-dependent dehydrogenase (short-subunit alcohol dehydrogenase family)